MLSEDRRIKVYLRTKELAMIDDFLNSKESVLNIIGNPGVGKTFVVKNALQSRDHLYVNYLYDSNFHKTFFKRETKIVVIDEFDKLKTENTSLAAKILFHVKIKKMKLITISNKLLFNTNLIRFKAYTSKEMLLIVKNKIFDEFGIEIEDNANTLALIKSLGKHGDLRTVYKAICNTVLEDATGKYVKNQILSVSPKSTTHSSQDSESVSDKYQDLLPLQIESRKQTDVQHQQDQYKKQMNVKDVNHFKDDDNKSLNKQKCLMEPPKISRYDVSARKHENLCKKTDSIEENKQVVNSDNVAITDSSKDNILPDHCPDKNGYKSIHHQLVAEIYRDCKFKSMARLYKLYVQKCMLSKIPYVSQTDFKLILDLLK